MGVQIIIAGESQCEAFAKTYLIADYLSQNLPHFVCKKIEKSILEWEKWLHKINIKYKWHHSGSPLVWKEMLIEGSKPYYIGGASEFLDYCYSYYKFEAFLSTEKFRDLVDSLNQFKKKHTLEKHFVKNMQLSIKDNDKHLDSNYIVCISGASHPLTMYLISGLLDMSVNQKTISKIYIYDTKCSSKFLDFVENECSYVSTNYPGKVVKHVTKIGMALTNCDLLIVMDCVPFRMDLSIGEWLYQNSETMKDLAPMINASASRNMYILLPNLGPACYNATLLTKLITNINKKNIVVVTSDLGLEIAPIAAEIVGIPLKNMFCPPVWGFVGINHLVDIKNTVHKYNVFEPFNRYINVQSSSLCIGVLTPELRTLEYLMHFNENLWTKLLDTKRKVKNEELSLNKATSVLNFVKLWLSGPNSNNILSLGIICDGSFGLFFNGVFSQPARCIDGYWQPAADFMTPKDPQMNVVYLAQLAEKIMCFKKMELPVIVPYNLCICLRKKKKDNENTRKKKTTFFKELNNNT
ncbi:unnamed protein product [Parnassius mnemosyne]|uniref:Malate dehydrogenase 1B n=1 Tax=Parnassius mnemosyne TaxID=213953 RepID=A0AAV1LWZ5_9NEOP